MMKLRHKLAEVEAFEFTQGMWDKVEPVPKGMDIRWESEKPLDPRVKISDPEPKLIHSNNIRSGLSVGCWILRSQETGECAVYYKKEYMMQDFSEVSG